MNSRNRLAILVVACASAMAWAAESKYAGDAYKDIARYQFGDSYAPIAAVEADIRAASVNQYKAIEAKLLAALKSPDAQVDGRRYILRLLGIVGSADAVPAIAACLGDEKLSHPARIALEAMALPGAGAALRDALPKVKGKLLAGVLSSIGVRKDAAAVSALAELTGDVDLVVAEAAIRAWG